MSELLLAHRFRVRSTLSRADGVALHVVRDTARERLAWLLHVARPSFGEMEMAIRHRLLDFGALPICAPCAVLDVVSEGEELFFLLDAPPGELAPLDVATLTSELREALIGQLGQLAQGRRWAGHLDPDQLRVRADGSPLLLPSAYAIPPAAESQEPSLFADRPRFWGASEVRTLCDRMGLSVPKLPAHEHVAESDSLEAELLEAFDAADAGGCVAELEDGSRAQELVHACMGRLVERFRGAVFTLGAHVRARHSTRRRSDGRPALLLIDGLRGYEAFADGLHALRRAGWLDGRESYLISRQGGESSDATELWFRSLRQHAAERYHRFEFSDVDGPTSVTKPHRNHVLELLTVAAHPLSARFIARSLSLDAKDLLATLHALRDRGEIELGHGFADTGGASVELLVFPVPGAGLVVNPTRREELRGLMAAAMESARGRAALGRQWMQFELLLGADPKRALPHARRLVERADRAGQQLLSYAVHARLLASADRLRPTLADRCRAAIAMGDQHRERGELDRAEEIFERALAELDRASGIEAAALAADLILIVVQLRMHQARYEECDALLQEAIERLRDQLDGTRRGRLYLRHADVLYHLGRFVDAKQRGELARKLLDPQSHPSELAMAYNRLALTLWQQSIYDEALSHMQRSLVLWEQVGDELWASRLYNNMSLVQRAMGRLNESEQSLTRAMELKQRVGDFKGLAAAQLNMGFLAIEQDRYRDAMTHAQLCLDQAEQLQQGELQAQAHGLWGEAAMHAGEYELAREQYLKDLELSEQHKMRNERVATLRRLVDLLLRTGEIDAAASRIVEARSALPLAGSRFESAMLDLMEARLMRSCGALEPALDLFGSSARVFAQLRRIDLQVAALAERGRLQLARGQRAGARRSLGELRELLAQHELVNAPPQLSELERELGSLQMQEQPAGAAISALAQLMALAGRDDERILDQGMQWVQEQLQPEQQLWIDGRSGRVRCEPPGRGIPQEATIDALRHGALDGRVAGDVAGWQSVVCGSAGVVALRRAKALGSEERDLLRLYAAAIGLLLTRPQSQRREGQGPASTAVGDPFGIIGQSPPMRDVLRQIELVRDNDMTVLLLGENGTGKDLFARAIHDGGRRRDASFHALNCAAIPAALLESELFGHERGAFTGAHDLHRGVFERADGGTLFLDEIGEMPLEMQAKLLRVLQDQSFQRVGGSETLHSNVRVIAATNRDLRQMVEEKRFRMDLYYRLNVITLQIPPLRERGEDIGLLARHFIERFAGEFQSQVTGIGQEAIARLMEYSWPGNVRELENVLKNAMVFAESSRIRVEDLPSNILVVRTARGGQSVEEAVRAMVVEDQLSEDRPLMPRLELLLAAEVVRAVGNKTRAARLLGITKPTLYSRLRRFEALYGQGFAAEG